MEKYIIKNNIPAKKRIPIAVYDNRLEAMHDFLEFYKTLSKFHDCKIYIRDWSYEDDTYIRGTIKAEIDGFFYYVELYKEK